jgi:DNA replication protein DnaC
MLEPTIEKLTSLRLGNMAQAVREMQDMKGQVDLSWQERLGLIVDQEWQERENRRLQKRLKEAKLTKKASLENVIADPARGLDRATLKELSQFRWLSAHHNLILVGATGTGKSYLAAALAEQACRKGHRALLLRMPRLFEELAIARAQGKYAEALLRLERFELLILDDFLMAPLTDPERRDLLELLEDRQERASIIFTSQTPPKTWHAAIGDPTIADAICDRIVHSSRVIALKGPSLRKSINQTT